jgi:16S rRNA processing protein RimM
VARQGRNTLTTSPEREDNGWVAVARIARPQGRHGEVAAEILTDFPERFARLRKAILALPGEPGEAAEVEDAWPHKGRIILKFAGVDSISEAERLRGMNVLIPRADRAVLAEGQYFVSELEGCRVLVERDGTTSELGQVTGLQPTGGVDLLRVETPRGEILVPLAQAICKRIDTESKVIIIDPPDELLELNQCS